MCGAAPRTASARLCSSNLSTTRTDSRSKSRFRIIRCRASLTCPQQVRIGHLVTSSPYTEYGVKGAGRGRPHGGAVACAIEDALRPLGVRIDSLPITPARLRSLIREAETGKGVR